jgi:hypothetical protein
MTLLLALLSAHPAAAQSHERPQGRGHQRPDHAHVRTGELQLQNHTRRTLDLYVDGTWWCSVAPGRATISLPEGDHRVRLELDGRLVKRASVDIDPWDASKLHVDAPDSASVRVVNPLPIDVIVELPYGGTHRIAAESSLTLDGMPVGTLNLSVRRVSGHALSNLSVDVDAWDGGSTRVRKPSTGLVELVNNESFDLAIYIDGTRYGRVDAGAVRMVELGLGDHRVDLVDERGRYDSTLYSRRVDVERYAAESVRTPGRASHSGRGHANSASCGSSNHSSHASRGHSGHGHHRRHRR